MRLGLALPHYDTSFADEPVSWESLRRAAVTADDAGFDSLWISDHLFLDWAKYGGPDEVKGSFECWTSLAAVAASTTTAKIGSLTLCNDFRNPALLAKMAASLDLLSGGRLELAIGAGWYEPEYRAAGLPFDRPADRIRRLGEAVEIVTRLLAGEEVTYSGRYYQIDRAICRPRPRTEPRPNVWIGGKGDLLLDTAARVADGWNFSWIGDTAVYAERAEAASRACERNGRDPSSLKRSVGAYVVTGTDERDVERRWERLVSRTPPGVLTPSNGGSAVSLSEFRRRSITGTVNEVAERLGHLTELGVDEVIVCLGAVPFQVADLDDVELVGTEVASALR